MNRSTLVETIVAAKLRKGLSWAEIAQAIGRSEVWTTAALLGQMSMSLEEAKAAGELLELDADAVALLQVYPSKGALGMTVPTDPLLYRFYEIQQVFGTTIKELIHEKFGDGIMSAIDFEMAIEKVPDPKGDRVKIVMNGKFLPYRKW
ncbi:cyanase [Thermithiobacillus plumbiphilus]|uniref:Cyanate hydratase n=1 Tax=Thermithiobacillus plumbiphilus TaxID=1729899 RepID=A0ABU9DAG6_9PROT